MDLNKHASQEFSKRFRFLKFCLLGLFLIVVAGVGTERFWKNNKAPVPSYNGKTLDQWLEMKFGIAPLPEEAQLAIREIGTNALPRLLELIEHNDSALKGWLYVNLPSVGNLRDGLTPYYVIQGRGVAGIIALGPVAEPAIPALAKFFDIEEGPHFEVAEALLAVGTKGMKIVQDGLSHTNSSVRSAAIHVLTASGRTNSELVATFRRALTDSEIHVREAATNALEEISSAAFDLSARAEELK